MDTSYPIVVLTLENNPSVEDITKEFYKKYPDDFHFITIHTTYPPTGALHFSAKNFIKGIGLPIYNLTSIYGSKGKLLGVNWLPDIKTAIEMILPDQSYILELDEKRQVSMLLHETTHQWAAYVDFIDENGKRSDSLRTPYLGRVHWNKKLETGYDPLGGYSWIDNGNGTFTAKPVDPDRLGYSNLTLYLMGLISKSEVGPIKLIISDRDESTFGPEYTISGTLKTISIQQIIDAEGERECFLP